MMTDTTLYELVHEGYVNVPAADKAIQYLIDLEEEDLLTLSAIAGRLMHGPRIEYPEVEP